MWNNTTKNEAKKQDSTHAQKARHLAALQISPVNRLRDGVAHCRAGTQTVGTDQHTSLPKLQVSLMMKWFVRSYKKTSIQAARDTNKILGDHLS